MSHCGKFYYDDRFVQISDIRIWKEMSKQSRSLFTDMFMDVYSHVVKEIHLIDFVFNDTIFLNQVMLTDATQAHQWTWKISRSQCYRFCLLTFFCVSYVEASSLSFKWFRNRIYKDQWTKWKFQVEEVGWFPGWKFFWHARDMVIVKMWIE